MEMTFKFDDNAYFATNSIKPVTITQFDDDYFELFMSKGQSKLVSRLLKRRESGLRHMLDFIIPSPLSQKARKPSLGNSRNNIEGLRPLTQPRGRAMKHNIKDIIGDIIGAICLFGIGIGAVIFLPLIFG